MGTRITSDVVEGYLNCKLKAHLKLNGSSGNQIGLRRFSAPDQARSSATSHHQARRPDLTGRDHDHLPLTASILRVGQSFLLDPILDHDPWLLRFDGLKKVEGSSELGDFHYVPLLFHEAPNVGKSQKLLLELYGWLLTPIQGRHPAYGVVWHGQECKVTKVRLNPDTRRCERSRKNSRR